MKVFSDKINEFQKEKKIPTNVLIFIPHPLHACSCIKKFSQINCLFFIYFLINSKNKLHLFSFARKKKKKIKLEKLTQILLNLEESFLIQQIRPDSKTSINFSFFEKVPPGEVSTKNQLLPAPSF